MFSRHGWVWIPFSGKVGNFSAAVAEKASRVKDPKFRKVAIESREAQAGPWPRPWDEEIRAEAGKEQP